MFWLGTDAFSFNPLQMSFPPVLAGSCKASITDMPITKAHEATQGFLQFLWKTKHKITLLPRNALDLLVTYTNSSSETAFTLKRTQNCLYVSKSIYLALVVSMLHTKAKSRRGSSRGCAPAQVILQDSMGAFGQVVTSTLAGLKQHTYLQRHTL